MPSSATSHPETRLIFCHTFSHSIPTSLSTPNDSNFTSNNNNTPTTTTHTPQKTLKKYGSSPTMRQMDQKTLSHSSSIEMIASRYAAKFQRRNQPTLSSSSPSYSTNISSSSTLTSSSSYYTTTSTPSSTFTTTGIPTRHSPTAADVGPYSGAKLAPPVMGVSIEGFERRYEQKAWYKIVVYPAHRTMPGGKTLPIPRKSFSIYRRYEDVLQFVQELQEALPWLRSHQETFHMTGRTITATLKDKTSTWSRKPRPRAIVTDAECTQRKVDLDLYLYQLFGLGPIISQSPVVSQFFGIWKTDMQIHLNREEHDPLALTSLVSNPFIGEDHTALTTTETKTTAKETLATTTKVPTVGKGAITPWVEGTSNGEHKIQRDSASSTGSASLSPAGLWSPDKTVISPCSSGTSSPMLSPVASPNRGRREGGLEWWPPVAANLSQLQGDFFQASMAEVEVPAVAPAVSPPGSSYHSDDSDMDGVHDEDDSDDDGASECQVEGDAESGDLIQLCYSPKGILDQSLLSDMNPSRPSSATIKPLSAPMDEPAPALASSSTTSFPLRGTPPPGQFISRYIEQHDHAPGLRRTGKNSSIPFPPPPSTPHQSSNTAASASTATLASATGHRHLASEEAKRSHPEAIRILPVVADPSSPADPISPRVSSLSSSMTFKPTSHSCSSSITSSSSLATLMSFPSAPTATRSSDDPKRNGWIGLSSMAEQIQTSSSAPEPTSPLTSFPQGILRQVNSTVSNHHSAPSLQRHSNPTQTPSRPLSKPLLQKQRDLIRGSYTGPSMSSASTCSVSPNMTPVVTPSSTATTPLSKATKKPSGILRYRAFSAGASPMANNPYESEAPFKSGSQSAIMGPPRPTSPLATSQPLSRRQLQTQQQQRTSSTGSSTSTSPPFKPFSASSVLTSIQSPVLLDKIKTKTKTSHPPNRKRAGSRTVATFKIVVDVSTIVALQVVVDEGEDPDFRLSVPDLRLRVRNKVKTTAEIVLPEDFELVWKPWQQQQQQQQQQGGGVVLKNDAELQKAIEESRNHRVTLCVI